MAILAMAFAAANRHPDPDAYAHKVVDAFDSLTEQPTATVEELVQNDAVTDPSPATEPQQPSAEAPPTDQTSSAPAQQPDPQQ